MDSNQNPIILKLEKRDLDLENNTTTQKAAAEIPSQESQQESQSVQEIPNQKNLSKLNDLESQSIPKPTSSTAQKEPDAKSNLPKPSSQNDLGNSEKGSDQTDHLSHTEAVEAFVSAATETLASHQLVQSKCKYRLSL